MKQNTSICDNQSLLSEFTENLERFLESSNHKCRVHDKSFNLMCIDENCQSRGLICSTCLTIKGSHKNHDAQQLIEYVTTYIGKDGSHLGSKSSLARDEVWDLINRAGLVYDQLLITLTDFMEMCNRIIHNYVAARTKLHQQHISNLSSNSIFRRIISCDFQSVNEANRLFLLLSSPAHSDFGSNSLNKTYQQAQAYLEDISYEHHFIGRELKKAELKIKEMLVVKNTSPVVLHFEPSFEKPELLESPEYIYIGETKQNRPWGKGTLYSKSGNKMIVGTFINGKAQGHAELYYETGDYYLGEFRNDRKDGRGAHRWNNQLESNLYEGEFKNGRRHGSGTFWWADGSKYVGGFQDGDQTGFGSLYREKQILQYQGYWLKGSFHGRGTQYFPNGEIYEGDFKFDKFNGEGILRKRNETIHGVWIDNELKIIRKQEKN